MNFTLPKYADRSLETSIIFRDKATQRANSERSQQQVQSRLSPAAARISRKTPNTPQSARWPWATAGGKAATAGILKWSGSKKPAESSKGASQQNNLQTGAQNDPKNGALNGGARNGSLSPKGKLWHRIQTEGWSTSTPTGEEGHGAAGGRDGEDGWEEPYNRWVVLETETFKEARKSHQLAFLELEAIKV